MIAAMLAPLALLLQAPLTVSAATDSLSGPPSAATNDEIAAHNASRNPRDADFIRCRRLPVPGSLVKKARVCKTNAEWAKSWAVGNQNARDTYDAMNRGSSNSVEPPDEFTSPGAPNRPN
jgi:hypothetical protein